MASVFLVHHPRGYAAIEHRIERLGGAITQAVAKDAVDMAPFKTGGLVSSIHTVRVFQFTWHVTVSADHWMTQEYGTIGRYPIIRPVHKKALWWPGLISPVSIVTKHPGNKATPFMRPAVYQVRAFWFSPNGGLVVSR